MNIKFTTGHRAERKPIPIEGYDHKGFFRQFCSDCGYWHAYLPGDAIRFSQCEFVRGAIELVSLGEADAAMADRIETGDPPHWQMKRSVSAPAGEVS